MRKVFVNERDTCVQLCVTLHKMQCGSMLQFWCVVETNILMAISIVVLSLLKSLPTPAIKLCG